MAAHVDGETPMEERDAAIEQFRSGTIPILCNVELFGEGVDIPSLEVAILLRPTQSLALYLQQVGRALRPMQWKEHAIILDHAGNSLRHGLPDEERSWSLTGREKSRRKSADDNIRVRVCPSCYAVQLPGRLDCSFCGHAFEINSREVDQKDGELIEVDKAEFKKQQRIEQGRCGTFQELVALGRARKMKNPYMWARYVWAARQNQKLAGANG
jgi:superfamily II DNA or RNA helicase